MRGISFRQPRSQVLEPQNNTSLKKGIIDKTHFKTRAIKRDPEGHFIILKGRIHQEDINIINIYALDIGAPKYIRKILEDFKKDIDSNTIIVRDFDRCVF